MADIDKEPTILLLDHSGRPGGGQLGLYRFAIGSNFMDCVVAFLTGGSVAERLKSKMPERVKIFANSRGSMMWILGAFRMIKLLRKMKPDVVVANSTKSALMLSFVPLWLFRGTRLVYLRDDLNPERLSKFRLLVMNRLVLPRFDGIVANSHWTASTVDSRHEEIPLRVAYPVSGCARASPTLPPLSGQKLRLLSLSRIARWKGIGVLVSAAQILAERGLGEVIEVRIVGDALFESEKFALSVQAEAANIGMQIVFPGHVDDVSEELESADVLLCCSTTPEPFGQVIVQGLAHGLVVVATNHGGGAEILTHLLDGALVRPRSANDIADVVQQLYVDSNLRERLRNNGRERAAKYLDDRTIPEFESAILELHKSVRNRR